MAERGLKRALRGGSLVDELVNDREGLLALLDLAWVETSVFHRAYTQVRLAYLWFGMRPWNHGSTPMRLVGSQVDLRLDELRLHKECIHVTFSSSTDRLQLNQRLLDT